MCYYYFMELEQLKWNNNIEPRFYLDKEENLYCFGNRHVVILTKEEQETLSQYHREEIRLSAFDVADMFPNALPTIKNLIKENNEKLRQLNLSKKESEKSVNKLNVPVTKKEYYISIINGFFDNDIIKAENHIKRLTGILLYLENKVSDKSKNYIDIKKIKSIPITNFVKFNSARFAFSVWNETEKTPSMYYYPATNTVRCFSTGRSGDVIDIIMAQRKCDFKEACKFLQS